MSYLHAAADSMADTRPRRTRQNAVPARAPFEGYCTTMPFSIPGDFEQITQGQSYPKFADYEYSGPTARPVSFAPEPVAPTAKETTDAVSRWYVDQVYDLLVRPGQYRPGFGGSDPALWGEAAVTKASMERIVGRSIPDFNERWAQMGFETLPHYRSELHHGRPPQYHTRDPYGLSYGYAKSSARMYEFVQDIVHRMGISTTAVIAGVWFLQGLGLHEADGDKGRGIRRILKTASFDEKDGVMKRACMLGLLLSGKWLDDNSFLNKSWNEVTYIRIKEIHQLELLALDDYHWSLSFPRDQWIGFIGTYIPLYTEHLQRYPDNRPGQIVLDLLKELQQQAHDQLQQEYDAAFSKLFGTTSFDFPEEDVNLERRLSISQLPAAGDQAVERDWDNFAQTYSIGSANEQRADATEDQGHDFNSDLEAERNVAALVGDDSMETEETCDEADEAESEFLEYDGAEPFFTELRRSTSNNTDMTFDSHDNWHTTDGCRCKTRQTSAAQVDQQLQVEVAPEYQRTADWVNNVAHAAAEEVILIDNGAQSRTPRFGHAKYLEPGIAVVRPDQALPAFSSTAVEKAAMRSYNAFAYANVPPVVAGKSRWSQRWDPALKWQ